MRRNPYDETRVPSSHYWFIMTCTYLAAAGAVAILMWVTA